MYKENKSFDIYSEAIRQFTICNSCRYCEGYCAVFPAIERRISYENNYIDYIANLCHDCRDCYSACPYIPPHEFSINIPMLLSSIRLDNYTKYTYPNKVSKIFFENPIKSSLLITIISVIATWLFALFIGNPSRIFQRYLETGSFYVILPDWAIIDVGFILLAYVLTLIGINSFKYWRTINNSIELTALIGGFWDSISHRYFKGGGSGCDYPEMFSGYKRFYAHLSLFLGFILTIMSTITAAIYQNILGLTPPYPYQSVPVILGILGGILIFISTSTLIYYKGRKSNQSLIEKNMVKLDLFLLILLNLIALTGIIVLVIRYTEYMGPILVTHVGLTVSLFLVAPYSKLIHIPYRVLSLIKYRAETET